MSDYNEVFLFYGDEFIKKAYSIFLNRDCDRNGLSYYRNRLRNGNTRYSVVRDILSSKEAKIILDENKIHEVLNNLKPFDDKKHPTSFFSQKAKTSFDIRDISDNLYRLSDGVNNISKELRSSKEEISSKLSAIKYLEKPEELKIIKNDPEKIKKVADCLKYILRF